MRINAYDVIQDGVQKVHERRTTNDKIGHPFNSIGRPRLECVLLMSNAMTFWRHLNLAIFSAKFIRRENNVTRYFSNFSENRSFLHNHANVVKILKSEQFILHDPSLNRLFMSEK